MSITDTNEGEAMRFSLVASRPIPAALLTHTRAVLAPFDPQERPVETDGLEAVTWTMTVPDDEALRSELNLELRGPAMALAIDSAIITGPLAVDGPKLIVTDVDSTFITSEVIEMIAKRAGTEDEVREITTAAMRGELDFGESLRERVATLAGVPDSVFDDVLADVRLTPGAARLVEVAHANGAKFGLVSGGFSPVVGPLAEANGVDVFVANGLQVTDGALTGRTFGPVIDREAKVVAVREWAATYGTTPEMAVCVGDGANDLGMLGIAGLGVAFCAKPIVVEQADSAISFQRLDAVCALVGWDVTASQSS